MDKKEEGGEKESCCSSGGSCGGKRCCSGKLALALVLLLIGGLIGYGMGRCHGHRMGCMTTMADCPMGGMKTVPPAK